MLAEFQECDKVITQQLMAMEVDSQNLQGNPWEAHYLDGNKDDIDKTKDDLIIDMHAMLRDQCATIGTIMANI